MQIKLELYLQIFRIIFLLDWVPAAIPCDHFLQSIQKDKIKDIFLPNKVGSQSLGNKLASVCLSNDNFSTVDLILIKFFRQVVYFNTILRFEYALNRSRDFGDLGAAKSQFAANYKFLIYILLQKVLQKIFDQAKLDHLCQPYLRASS